jgi:hypothetical protein
MKLCLIEFNFSSVYSCFTDILIFVIFQFTFCSTQHNLYVCACESENRNLNAVISINLVNKKDSILCILL